MKRNLLFFIFCLFVLGQLNSQKSETYNIIFTENNYENSFSKAYQLNPEIPKGLLEAFSYYSSSFLHLTESNVAESCVGIPRKYSVMGLTADGKNYFRNNLQLVSQHSGYSLNQIKNDPEISILAFAKAYTTIKNQLGIVSNDIHDHMPILIELAELPKYNLGEDFPMDSHLYGILFYMNDIDFQQYYNLPSANIDFSRIFGANNFKVLSASNLTLSDTSISIDGTNTVYNSYTNNSRSACSMPSGPTEYSGALWNAANSSNYSSTSSPYMVTLHTIQGSYAGAISWFKNSTANVSVQFCTRKSDGQITQMTCLRTRAWHVTSNNSSACGIEHDGYAEQIATWTQAQLNASVNLTAFMSSTLGIDTRKAYDGPGYNTYYTLSNSCWHIKGHQSFPSNTHKTDPGLYFPFDWYYAELNSPALAADVQLNTTNSSGVLYDDGGANGDYSSNVRSTYLISPDTCPDSLKVYVLDFDLENSSGNVKYDRMFIYDGINNSAPLIGMYWGGNPPPSIITPSSGSIFIDFRSDCAVNGDGFKMAWSTCTSSSSGGGGGSGGSSVGVCGNPLVIECDKTFTGTTSNGQSNFDNYFSYNTPQFGKEKVHRFSLVQASDVDISISSTVDLDLHLVSGSFCDTSNIIQSRDNSISATNLSAGDHYLIVDGAGPQGNSAEGAYTLTLSCNVLAIDTSGSGGGGGVDSTGGGVDSSENVGLIELNSDNIKLYPNPTTGLVNINVNSRVSDDIDFNLINSIGQMIEMRISKIKNNVYQIDMTGLSKGVYTIILSNSSSQYTKRLIKE